MVPYPQTVAPLKLRPVQATHRLVGRVILGAAIFLVIGAAGVVVGPRVVERLTPSSTDSQSESSTSVLGATTTTNDVRGAIGQFVVGPEDLPRTLAAYRRDDADAGVATRPLGDAKTIAGYRATYVGLEPLDVFTSSAGLFATAERGAQAYAMLVAPAALKTLTGQAVSVVAAVEAGEAGVVFRANDEVETATRRFGGAVVMVDRVIHLVFGFFPAVVTNQDLVALVTGSVTRYAEEAGVRAPGADARRDADRDGLTHALEAALGTDPDRSDSDADGYDDGTEVQGGYDALGEGRAPSTNGLFEIPGLTE